MNRIAKELAETLPQPKGPFTDAEALELLMAYRKDPSNVPCPMSTTRRLPRVTPV